MDFDEVLARIRRLFGKRRRKKSELSYRFPEATTAQLDLMQKASPYTMTSMDRRWALIQSVIYTVKNEVPGDFVEAGVWRGGSSLVAAQTFLSEGSTDRTLWLYDTYQGMSEPSEHDQEVSTGSDALTRYRATQDSSEFADWCRAGIEDVQATMALCDYPKEKVSYIAGKVEETLQVSQNLPEKISILRLDTDWYESTKAELEILFPRLSVGGVLIIDDYGHWAGSKKAFDEYFINRLSCGPLIKIDKSCRLTIKLSE